MAGSGHATKKKPFAKAALRAIMCSQRNKDL
jgi:hypothetical protein